MSDIQDAPTPFTALDIIDQHELYEGFKGDIPYAVFKCSCGRWNSYASKHEITSSTFSSYTESVKLSWLAHIQRERDALRGDNREA